MTRFISKFRADECGAVTVDWVVLTAGIVGLSIAVLASVGGSTADSGDDIALCQNGWATSWRATTAPTNKTCGQCSVGVHKFSV